jgi:uncharacterized membrane protein
MTTMTYEIVLLAGLILAASVAGILLLYSHTIMPGLRSTDNATFVRAFQAIDRHIINPIFMAQFFLPVALLGVACWYANSHNLAEWKYLAVATACYVLAVVITMAVNVPLNDGIKKIADTTSADSLTQARAQFNESKWTLFNHIRTALVLVACCLTAVAIGTSRLV